MIEEAEEHLRAAAAFKRMGRYQLEAAIQSIHAHRTVSGCIDWPEIALLYEGLAQNRAGNWFTCRTSRGGCASGEADRWT